MVFFFVWGGLFVWLFLGFFLLRNRICDTKNHGLWGKWLCYEICPNDLLTICWLSPESFSFPDQKKPDIFSPVELLIPCSFLAACAVAHFKSKLILSFPTVSPEAASARHPAGAIYPSPWSLFVSLCRAVKRDHLPGSPVWPRWCCSVCAGLTSCSNQGPTAAAAAVSRAGDVQACGEMLWAASPVPNPDGKH